MRFTPEQRNAMARWMRDRNATMSLVEKNNETALALFMVEEVPIWSGVISARRDPLDVALALSSLVGAVINPTGYTVFSSTSAFAVNAAEAGWDTSTPNVASDLYKVATAIYDALATVDDYVAGSFGRCATQTVTE